MTKYRGFSLEEDLVEEAKKYAKEEGFKNVTDFIRFLIKTYPYTKRLRLMFEQGFLVPSTQNQIQTQNGSIATSSYMNAYPVSVNQANILNLNITNKFNFVVMDERIVEEKGTVVINPLKEYEPETEEVYEKGIKVISFKPKK